MCLKPSFFIIIHDNKKTGCALHSQSEPLAAGILLCNIISKLLLLTEKLYKNSFLIENGKLAGPLSSTTGRFLMIFRLPSAS